MFVFRKIDRNETGSTRERVNTRRGNPREPSVVVARIDERTAETSRSFFSPFPPLFSGFVLSFIIPSCRSFVF